VEETVVRWIELLFTVEGADNPLDEVSNLSSFIFFPRFLFPTLIICIGLSACIIEHIQKNISIFFRIGVYIKNIRYNNFENFYK